MSNNKSTDAVAASEVNAEADTSNMEESAPSSEKNLAFNYQENKIANILAVFAAFLFAVGLGFLVYKQFISTKVNLSDNFKPEITQEAANSTREGDDMAVAGVKTTDNEQNRDSSADDEQTNDPRQGDVIKANDKESLFSPNAQWRATDYKKGDISKGSYTVKSGDTLWEIAEAVYGDGGQWTTILQANSGSIDHLPSGQQSLIYTGQVLVIP